MKGARIIVKNLEDIKNRIEHEKSPNAKIKLVFLNLVSHSSFNFENICQLCGVAVSTGYQWVREWNEKGYGSVKEKENKGGRHPKLSEEDLQQLKRYLEEREQWKTKEVRKLVNERFDVDLSDDQIARILKRLLKKNLSKNAEKDFHRQDEEKYREFFINASEAIIINDLEDRVTAWNPGAEKMFGWEAHEAIGKKPTELIVPSNLQEERIQIIRKVLSGRRIEGADTVRLHKDGTRINVSLTVFPLRNAKQNIIGLSYLIKDITKRKRAEEALRESEERLRNVMESAPVGISITTPEDEVVDINSTGLKIFGYDSKEEFLKIPVSSHYYEALDKERFYELAKKGKVVDFEVRLKRKDSTVFCVSTSTIAHTTSTGATQFINVFRDITERRRTEEVLRRVYDELEIKVQERTAELEEANELVQSEITERRRAMEAVRESKARYRNLVESARDIIFTISPDGMITSLNVAFETITGWRRDEWLDKNFQLLLHPDDLPFANEIYQRVLNGETPPPSLEVRLLSRSDEYVPMDVSITPQTQDGKVIHVLCIARNINERKQTEKQMLEQAALLRKEIIDRKYAEKELRRAYDELEIRVQERTGELAKTNEALQAEITERKRAEEERERLLKDIQNKQQHAELLTRTLKKERDTLQIIMENTGTRLAYLDSKFNFIRVNSAYAKDLGLNKEEILSKNYFELFSNPENQVIFERVRDTGEAVELKANSFRFENQPWRGMTYWDWTLAPVKDASGHVDRLVLSLTDVTERVRVEQAIQKALTYAEIIIDTIPEPLLILDSQLRVKMANHAFYKTFKVSIEDTTNRLLYDLGNRQWDIPGLRELLEEIVPRNTEIVDFEVDHEFPGIGRRTMLLNARRIYRKDIDSEMILLSINDITERKKIEEIRLENERLVSASSARSEFLTIMSHELRTPLTSITGYSILLREKTQGKLNEKQEFYLDNILASSKHLLSLINGILDLAKIEAGKLEMVIEDISVPETINEILYLMKEKAARHNIILKKEFDPELSPIKADRQKFKQILFNLLSNAMKFSKEDGGSVAVSAKKEGDTVKISVSDTGIGIREEDIPRLFQKFEQLDSGISRKYGGTGLGLAITKQLVELSGGKIMVESKYGEGSTFTFLLPIMAKAGK